MTLISPEEQDYISYRANEFHKEHFRDFDLEKVIVAATPYIMEGLLRDCLFNADYRNKIIVEIEKDIVTAYRRWYNIYVISEDNGLHHASLNQNLYDELNQLQSLSKSFFDGFNEDSPLQAYEEARLAYIKIQTKIRMMMWAFEAEDFDIVEDYEHGPSDGLTIGELQNSHNKKEKI